MSDPLQWQRLKDKARIVLSDLPKTMHYGWREFGILDDRAASQLRPAGAHVRWAADIA